MINEINPVVLCFIVYLLLINGMAFVVMGVDKKRAKRHEWRIPEKTLFLLALLGGSLGGIFGMQYFRHKTKHYTFIIGFPLILIVQIGAAVWLFLI